MCLASARGGRTRGNIRPRNALLEAKLLAGDATWGDAAARALGGLGLRPGEWTLDPEEPRLREEAPLCEV